MREPTEPVKPGDEVTASLTWDDENQAVHAGSRVEATDGFMGVVRERQTGGGSSQAYLTVTTDTDVLLVPERLIRETRGDTVFLSLPMADVRAQSSAMPGSTSTDRPLV